MGLIQVLPDAVINQIAAGEVVERPASVVKELAENALDAGATQISITLHDGGKDSISVLDNGRGMDAEDAHLAIQRHATSKIHTEQDLSRIRTLGFRGEALASIAAVSRFELTSCSEERAGGLRLSVEGGRVRSAGKIGFPRGSKVVVEELFFNTPARRKFLRATSTEFQHVQTTLVNLALAHPTVQFRLSHNGRPVYDLPAGTGLLERAHQLFGKDLAQGLVAVSGQEPTFRYEGLISDPDHARASRRWQYLFINTRPVRNTGLNHAVYQAYRTLLMKDRHPAYILKLSLGPEEVDVNVHPAKSEVRLRNAALMHTVLAGQLHRQLTEESRRRAFGLDQSARRPSGPGFGPGRPGTAAPAVASLGAWPAVQDNPLPLDLPPTPPPAPNIGTGEDTVLFAPPSPAPSPARTPDPSRHSGQPWPEPGTPAGSPRSNPFQGEGFHFQALSPRPAAEPSLLEGTSTVLGQFHATYLLVQRGESLMLVDQHAAHERILFEQYRTQFYEGRLITEAFLIPLTLELSPQNALLLEQYLPQWEKMGFALEPFGRNSYLVRQVPAILSGKDVPALILEVLDELALFGKSGRLEEVFNDILERVACHSAIRAGALLSREEMESLMAQLEGLDINLYCPHGRPVWVEFPLRELEKRFKRIV